jgi:hypothetical protein
LATGGGSTVVEKPTHNPKTEGLNPTAGTARDKDCCHAKLIKKVGPLRQSKQARRGGDELYL